MRISHLVAAASLLALTSASAQAADLLIEGPAVVAEQYSPTWDGAYIGAFGGYGWGEAITPEDIDIIFDETDALGIEGGLIGLTAGVNFTLGDGSVVLGVAGDIAATQIDAFDEELGTTVEIEWAGSLRGVVGLNGGDFMPYLTAGLAGASARVDYAGDADSNFVWGWTAGAGVQFAVAENVGLDLQYRYTEYDGEVFAVVPDTEVELSTHQVTAGLNLKF